MARRDVRVPLRYYLRLADALARQRIDIVKVMKELGLPASLLMEPDATVKFSQVESLIEHVGRITDRSDLGYELGKLLSVSSHSIVGFGMLSCQTLGLSLAFVARYFRLIMPTFRLRYTNADDCSELHFSPLVAMGHECLTFHLEAMATAALRDVQELSGGRSLPCRLQFSFPRPPHARRYAELRGVQTEFGLEPLPGVRLRFEADLREIPLTMADPNALNVAEERCRAQVAQVASVRQFSEWVAMTLREVSEGMPTLAELAGMLNISTRTLNRYLEREGTSFRELSGRIQHELARERLAAGVMSVTEIAYSLGFADPANFTRSFRDREGMSPRDYCRKLGVRARASNASAARANHGSSSKLSVCHPKA